MRVIAVSDSHGCRGLLREAVMQATARGKVDVFVHCGDGVRDVDTIAPILTSHNPDVQIYAVRGNCDVSAFAYPATELFEAGGVRMMATHGDLCHVKSGTYALCNKARELGAQVAFFGHTHTPLLQPAAGTYLINPGSLAKQGGIYAYAQVLVHADGRFTADLYRWLA